VSPLVKIAAAVILLIGLALIMRAMYLADSAIDQAAEAHSTAARVQGDLTEKVRRDTEAATRAADDGALSSYRACLRGNRGVRPASRITAQVLRELVVTVNAAGPGLPDAFARAPRRLNRAIRLLFDVNCARVYRDGYLVAVERDLVPPPKEP